jgi:H+/Cl- antiporter ClcA
MFEFIHNLFFNAICIVLAAVSSYAAVKRFNYTHHYIENKTRSYYWKRFLLAVIYFIVVYFFVGFIAEFLS